MADASTLPLYAELLEACAASDTRADAALERVEVAYRRLQAVHAATRPPAGPPPPPVLDAAVVKLAHLATLPMTHALAKRLLARLCDALPDAHAAHAHRFVYAVAVEARARRAAAAAVEAHELPTETECAAWLAAP